MQVIERTTSIGFAVPERTPEQEEIIRQRCLRECQWQHDRLLKALSEWDDSAVYQHGYFEEYGEYFDKWTTKVLIAA